MRTLTVVFFALFFAALCAVAGQPVHFDDHTTASKVARDMFGDYHKVTELRYVHEFGQIFESQDINDPIWRQMPTGNYTVTEIAKVIPQTETASQTPTITLTAQTELLKQISAGMTKTNRQIASVKALLVIFILLVVILIITIIAAADILINKLRKIEQMAALRPTLEIASKQKSEAQNIIPINSRPNWRESFISNMRMQLKGTPLRYQTMVASKFLEISKSNFIEAVEIRCLPWDLEKIQTLVSKSTKDLGGEFKNLVFEKTEDTQGCSLFYHFPNTTAKNAQTS